MFEKFLHFQVQDTHSGSYFTNISLTDIHQSKRKFNQF